MHGDGADGTTGIDDDFAARGKAGLGAWILGRNTLVRSAASGPTTYGRGGGVPGLTTCPAFCSLATRALRS